MTEQPEPAPAAAPDQDPDVASDGETEPERTGVDAADAAADRLRELDEAPLDEHVEIYEDVHRQLQEGLADLDEQ